MSTTPATPVTPSRFRWLRFSLGNLFALTLGIVLGFIPFRLHETFAPPSPEIAIDVEIVTIPVALLERLKWDLAAHPSGRMADKVFDEQWEIVHYGEGLDRLSSTSLLTLDNRPTTLAICRPMVHETIEQSIFQEACLRVDIHPKLLRNGRIQLDMIVEKDREFDDTENEPRAVTISSKAEFSQEVASGERIYFSLDYRSRENEEPQRILIVSKVRVQR